jgi:hypothetical protein
MSTSTGAPAARARSEGVRLATKGTAAPTASAPPAPAVAMSSRRRDGLQGASPAVQRAEEGVAVMGVSLLGRFGLLTHYQYPCQTSDVFLKPIKSVA